MLTEAAEKILDVTEAGVVRAADTCMQLGSWLVPYCYRREYARRAADSRSGPDVREQEEGLVRGIGEMVIGARRGDIDVGPEEIQTVVTVVGPTLHGVGYADVFDPHRAKLLEKIAPLHSGKT